MSTVLERARSHYDSLDKRSIKVPEWDEGAEPLTVYWRPWTIAQKRAVYKGEPDDLTLAARIIEAKAQDGTGARLFSKGDSLHLMMHTDERVIARVAKAIMFDRDDDDDDDDDGDEAGLTTTPEFAGTVAAVEQAEKN